MHVLKWARANGAPWDTRTCSYAAKNGHLEVIQWAHANGAPWDMYTCIEAATNGHVNVLEWACANGAPFDALLPNYNHPNVLQWIREKMKK